MVCLLEVDIIFDGGRDEKSKIEKSKVSKERLSEGISEKRERPRFSYGETRVT